MRILILVFGAGSVVLALAGFWFLAEAMSIGLEPGGDPTSFFETRTWLTVLAATLLPTGWLGVGLTLSALRKP